MYIRGLGKLELLPHRRKLVCAINFCSNNDKTSGINVPNDINNPILPEEPTTCCMSGCANCVWLDYAEKMSQYFKDGGEKVVKEINERINDPNIKAFILQELRMRKLQ